MPLNAISRAVVTVSQLPVFALTMLDTRQSEARTRSAALANRGDWAPAVKLAISRWL